MEYMNYALSFINALLFIINIYIYNKAREPLNLYAALFCAFVSVFCGLVGFYIS